MGTIKFLSDSHIHTHFSSDSDALVTDIINKAMELELSSICFTDHNDFNYPENDENGNMLFQLNLREYFTKMSDFKEKYAGKLSIYIGVEQGLQSSVSHKINSYGKGYDLDFIIGSSHLINGADPYYKNYWNNKNTKEVIVQYFKSIIDNIKSCTNFDVYGHLDYIVRYCPNKDNDYNPYDYMDLLDEILKLLIKHNKGIEINTAGLNYGLKQAHPHIELLKRYKELGGELITLGSDAHKAENIAYDFEILQDMLYEAGFNYYNIFEHRKPKYIKIV